MRKYYLSFVLLLSCISSYGQYYTNQNKMWTFGYHSGLNFNSGVPVQFYSSDSAREGTTTLSDGDGNLLFYTDGRTVYNRTGAIMPNGGAVVPYYTGSSTQSSVIAPAMITPSQYYLFSVEPIETGLGYGVGLGRLAYSKVDMLLDGGYGDVMSGISGLVLEDSMAEKIVAIPGNNCNVWILTHKKYSPDFYAYEITISGISAPVISSSGWSIAGGDYVIGVMKASHDYTKIALQGYGQHVELHDFNTLTGEVSGCKVIEPGYGGGYGAEFSPDDTKLYITNYGTMGHTVYQYNLTDTSTAAIIASKTNIGLVNALTDLKLAADGKVYFMSDSISPAHTCTMGRIEHPNNAGGACGYVRSCLALSSAECGFGLPNTFVAVDTHSFVLPPILGADTVCAGSIITLSHPSFGGSWSSDGTHTTVDVYGNVTALAPGIDTVFYTVDYGACKDIAKHVVFIFNCSTDTVVVDTTKLAVGVVQGANIDVQVFPNPSKGTFSLLTKTATPEPVSVVVTDLLGRQVQAFTIASGDKTEVRIPQRGVYMLYVSTAASGRRILRVVIE